MDEHKIINGNALEVLRIVPGESINMCLTSPPYWGLRDYGVEQIFGGDPSCKHKWGADIIQKQRGAPAGATAQVGNQKKKIQGTHINQGKYCQKCQAWKGQLGLEPTPEFYIEHLTEIFREVKRVLKKEGTLWLNIGDTYGGSCQGRGDTGLSKERYRKELLTYVDRPQKNMMPKCLLMIPERLAWSLIQDGWILRNKIIWYKPNSMPSSVKDRFSNRWEYIFLFSKSSKPVYWTNKKTLKLITKQPAGIKGIKGEDWEWGECPKCEGDGEIIYKEKSKKCSRCKSLGKIKISFWAGHNYYFDLDAMREPYTEPLNRWGGGTIGIPKKTKWKSDDEKAKWAMSMGERKSRPNPTGKNPGDVFEINTQSFPEAHFAVFPEKLCEKPIRAGCPEQVCKKCGKAREKKYKPKFTNHDGQTNTSYNKKTSSAGRLARLRQAAREKGGEYQNKREFIGYSECSCGADFEGGTVLDPFCGAGTTGVVAKKLDRKFIGIDISEKFCEMARKRIAGTGCQLELK